MEYLNTRHNGKTFVEIYISKQLAFTQAVAKRTEARQSALTAAIENRLNETEEQVKAQYDEWQEQYDKKYRDTMNAAFLDWVDAGRKFGVEHAMNLTSSLGMDRVEQSMVRTFCFRVCSI